MSVILIAGGTGLVGMHLSRILVEKGHQVRHLSRRPRPAAAFPAYAWNPKKGTIDAAAFSGVDYVVNLAGANLAEKRWTPAQKRRIIESRTQSSRLLGESIAALSQPIRGYISASAIGFYGNRGDEWLRETSAPGDGFVPEVVRAWEASVGPIAETGVRTVILRIGIVLSTRGGALKSFLTPFRFFTGTWFGDGRAFYSWIHPDDLAGIFAKAIEDPEMAGVYNAVAPAPVSCKDLVVQIKKALGRPAFLFGVPAFLLKILMGEMSVIVTDSTRVSCEKIQSAGYVFRFPELPGALRDILRRGL